MTYQAKDFSPLKGMKGFSDELLDDHFSLYEGYVKNTNELLEKLSALMVEGDGESAEQAELRRRLAWEWNGMRLHEFYFENLGGSGQLGSSGELFAKIEEHFGDLDRWRREFKAIGGMRGIGWTILYYDPLGDRLLNLWINEHDSAHLAGSAPLLVMDVWEHAFFTDYRTDRKGYIEAFMANIKWGVAEKRLEAGRNLEALAARG